MLGADGDPGGLCPIGKPLPAWTSKALWPLLRSIDSLERRVMDAKFRTFGNIIRAVGRKMSQVNWDRSIQVVYSPAAR